MFRREKEESKKKKKDQEQEHHPWGKSERYLLTFVLLTSVAISGVLALYARSWKLPGFPRFKIPENVFEETFVIEGNLNSEEYGLGTKEQRIVSNFEKATKKLSGVYGFEVIDLKTGARFGSNQDEEYQAASLMKLPLMAFLFEQAERKRINLSTKHSLQEEEKKGGSGVLQYEPAGTVITNRELIEYMGQHSDNTAFNIALGLVGESNLQEYISEIGMRNTFYEANTTSVRDITSFFKKLWEQRLVSEEDRDEILSYLTDTSYEEYLRAGVPEDVRVAHKYGREIHVVNDAGIVFAENPYIVVIMSKGVLESEADEIFPELSRLIFQGMLD